jgi:septum formation protein
LKSKIVLRSASPRRKAFLEGLGLPFEIAPLSLPEDPLGDESPAEYLKRVTLLKLGNNDPVPENLYIAADTIVVFSNQIYPKPETEDVNLRYLQELNGKTHSVWTGLGLQRGEGIVYDCQETLVSFQEWNHEERKSYVRIYNPLDKAGGYGVQDEKGPVKKITGSYWNAVGFPARIFYSHHKLWSGFMQ